MRDEYDFSDAVRNPYAERILQHGYAIVVNCGVAQDSSGNAADGIPSAYSVAEKKVKYNRAND